MYLGSSERENISSHITPGVLVLVETSFLKEMLDSSY